NYSGFAGTIASGILRKGDLVRALPSGKTSRIKTITTFDGDLHEAFAPMSVTVTLEDEIDVSRGDMLIHAEKQEARTKKQEVQPIVSSDIDAMIVWMHEQPFVPGKTYLFKHTTRLLSGAMVELAH